MLKVIEVIDKRRWLGSHQSGGEWMTSISLWNRDPWGCVVNFKVPFCSLFTFPLQEKLNILYIFMLYDYFFFSQVLELLSFLFQHLYLPTTLPFLSYMALLHFFFTAHSHHLLIFSEVCVKVIQQCCISWPWITAEPLGFKRWIQEVNSAVLVLMKNKRFEISQ